MNGLGSRCTLVSDTGIHGNRPLTADDLKAVWKKLTIARLQQILGVSSLAGICDTYGLSSDNIMHNVTFVGKNGMVTNIGEEDRMPAWVTSAMQCLLHWPNAFDESLPSYPGFEKDVFQVVRDYFTSLQSPIVPATYYELFNKIFDVIKKGPPAHSVAPTPTPPAQFNYTAASQPTLFRANPMGSTEILVQQMSGRSPSLLTLDAIQAAQEGREGQFRPEEEHSPGGQDPQSLRSQQATPLPELVGKSIFSPWNKRKADQDPRRRGVGLFGKRQISASMQELPTTSSALGDSKCKSRARNRSRDGSVSDKPAGFVSRVLRRFHSRGTLQSASGNFRDQPTVVVNGYVHDDAGTWRPGRSGIPRHDESATNANHRNPIKDTNNNRQHRQPTSGGQISKTSTLLSKFYSMSDLSDAGVFLRANLSHIKADCAPIAETPVNDSAISLSDNYVASDSHLGDDYASLCRAQLTNDSRLQRHGAVPSPYERHSHENALKPAGSHLRPRSMDVTGNFTAGGGFHGGDPTGFYLPATSTPGCSGAFTHSSQQSTGFFAQAATSSSQGYGTGKSSLSSPGSNHNGGYTTMPTATRLRNAQPTQNHTRPAPPSVSRNNSNGISHAPLASTRDRYEETETARSHPRTQLTALKNLVIPEEENITSMATARGQTARCYNNIDESGTQTNDLDVLSYISEPMASPAANDPPELRSMPESQSKRCVQCLQLCCLFLPPANRRTLHLLLQLLHKLIDDPEFSITSGGGGGGVGQNRPGEMGVQRPGAASYSTFSVFLDLFTHAVLGAALPGSLYGTGSHHHHFAAAGAYNGIGYGFAGGNSISSRQMLALMIKHYKQILRVPDALKREMDRFLAQMRLLQPILRSPTAPSLAPSTHSSRGSAGPGHSRNPSFDGVIRAPSSRGRSPTAPAKPSPSPERKAPLLEFLDNIIADDLMSSKEKKKRLKQFQKIHPEVYAQRFSSAASVGHTAEARYYVHSSASSLTDSRISIQPGGAPAPGSQSKWALLRRRVDLREALRRFRFLKS